MFIDERYISNHVYYCGWLYRIHFLFAVCRELSHGHNSKNVESVTLLINSASCRCCKARKSLMRSIFHANAGDSSGAFTAIPYYKKHSPRQSHYVHYFRWKVETE